MFPWFVGGACDDFISGELRSKMESIEAELEKSWLKKICFRMRGRHGQNAN